MNTNILLLETEGTVLKTLQNNSVKNLTAETFYLHDPEMGIDFVLRRQIGVVVVHFGSNLTALQDFCVKTLDESPFFIMFVLLIDEKSRSDVNQIKFVHQIVVVSSSEQEIITTINRGIQVSNDVQSKPKLAFFLSNLGSIPSYPSVYFDLRDQLSLPSCNANALTDLVSRDQALAARVLSVVNSGFYAMPRTISSLQQAITLLGTETVLGLVLATHLFNSLPLPGVNLDNLWKHAIGVASLSRHIAKARGGTREQIEESGIAGLLHDLGCLVFIANKPMAYQLMLRSANGDELALMKSEQENFGIDHSEIGGILLFLWGLPDSVVNAVKYHHDYDLITTFMPSAPVSSLAIAEWVFNFSEQVDDTNREELLAKNPFDCSTEQLEQWMDVCEQIQVRALV